MADDDGAVEKLLDLFDKADAVVEEMMVPAIEIMEADKRVFALEDLVVLVARLYDLKGEIDQIEVAVLDATERERYKEQYVVLPDGGSVELGYSASSGRKWDSPKLVPVAINAVVRRNVNEDGELEASAAEMMNELIDMVGINYWRVGDLARYDLDPDEFSEKRPRKFRAKVHKKD